MPKVAAPRKIVRPLPKGQITIPAPFRQALGIDAHTLLRVSLVGDRLEIEPLRPESESLRRYTEGDITRFLEEDKLDEATVRRVRALLKRRKL
ncbi:MAG: AbrB/MazE/SpoVT family DNA-binding domain-containing protein [Chloroflexi bacterium]|nr:AbrB/MazE/SpoVT family DNA-binding domain-containing protein [Chloroflexota bacterium]